jgi:rod shape-determining protein MreC
VVSIFTYRDERKLFAVIGAIIAAALVALIQLEFARQGRASPINSIVTTSYAYLELAFGTAVSGVRGGLRYVVDLPRLARDNATLRQENATLEAENQALKEALSRVPSEIDAKRAAALFPTGIPATVIGFDPENKQQIVTVNKGTQAGVAREDGVVDADGVVGRVIEADPLTSKVLLITDYTSNLPAVVQNGRWWGIATGTLTRINLHYVSQDAHLHVGDAVVTGEGRSFHAGLLIGHIASVTPMPAGALDQQAIVEPAAAFGRLDHVVILSK